MVASETHAEPRGSVPLVAPHCTGAWLTTVAALFRARVESLSDAALDEPTPRPGWSRRHVLGHLHYNALVLGRLARSVAAGAPQPLDPPADRWQAWRPLSERMSARYLRDLLKWAEEDLEDAFGELDAESRSARIAEIPGLRVSAEDLPWLRVRELAVHLVDLDDAVDPSQLPAGLVSRLAADLGELSPGVADANRPASAWALCPAPRLRDWPV